MYYTLTFILITRKGGTCNTLQIKGRSLLCQSFWAVLAKFVRHMCINCYFQASSQTSDITIRLSDSNFLQVAQLSSRDRVAGWVSCCQKRKTIFCRQYTCRSVLNHCDVYVMYFIVHATFVRIKLMMIGLQSYRIP